MASRKSSKTQSITPRAGSNPKIHKQAPSVTKLQKRCKHIINNNYAENDKDEVVIKDDASKSLTYINK